MRVLHQVETGQSGLLLCYTLRVGPIQRGGGERDGRATLRMREGGERGRG